MEWEIINGMAVSARDVKLGIDSRQAEKTALLQHFRMGCTGQLFDSFFSDSNCQDVHAQQVLIGYLFVDTVYQPDPYVPAGLIQLHNPVIFRGIKSGTVVPDAKNDFIIFADYADIRAMMLVIQGEAMFDYISGHLLHTQGSKEGSARVNFMSQTELADLFRDIEHFLLAGDADVNAVLRANPDSLRDGQHVLHISWKAFQDCPDIFVTVIKFKKREQILKGRG